MDSGVRSMQGDSRGAWVGMAFLMAAFAIGLVLLPRSSMVTPLVHHPKEYWAGGAGKIELATTQSGHQSVYLVDGDVNLHIGSVTSRTQVSFKGMQFSTISEAENRTAIIIARVIPRPGTGMWSEILEATVLVRY